MEKYFLDLQETQSQWKAFQMPLKPFLSTSEGQARLSILWKDVSTGESGS